MRAAAIAPLLASLAACAPTAFDHYDPHALEALARERQRQGDTRTARILAERAARLAPHDRRIAPPAADAPRAAAEPRVAPEPPPLWPAK